MFENETPENVIVLLCNPPEDLPKVICILLRLLKTGYKPFIKLEYEISFELELY